VDANGEVVAPLDVDSLLRQVQVLKKEKASATTSIMHACSDLRGGLGCPAWAQRGGGEEGSGPL
jgi:hypothetical protein